LNYRIDFSDSYSEEINMIRAFLLALAIFISQLITSDPAHAQTKFSFAAIQHETEVDYSQKATGCPFTTYEASKRTNTGFGLLFEVPVASYVGLEFGLAKLHREIRLDNLRKTEWREYKWDNLYLPITLKVWPIEYINIIAGMYYMKAEGGVDFKWQAGGYDASHDTFDLKDDDKGYTYGLGAQIPITEKGAIFVEYRKLNSFENYSTQPESELKYLFQDTQIMGGFRLISGP
jgi:hypothetical protein